MFKRIREEQQEQRLKELREAEEMEREREAEILDKEKKVKFYPQISTQTQPKSTFLEFNYVSRHRGTKKIELTRNKNHTTRENSLFQLLCECVCYIQKSYFELQINTTLGRSQLLDDAEIEVLCDFGLTINQAKVYASIIDFKSLTVKDVSEITKLHIQDIYKIIPKLQQMGLVTKTVNRPARIEVIPVRNALMKLITEQKADAIEKAKILERKIEILDIFQKNQNALQTQKYQVFVIPKGKALDAKAASVFNSKLNKYDLVCTWNYFLKTAAPYLKIALKRIGRNARIRILVTCIPSPEDFCYNKVENAIKEIATKDRFFSGKILMKELKSTFALLNDIDLWIPTIIPIDKGDIIINNSIDTANFAKEAYEYFWSDPLARTVVEISP